MDLKLSLWTACVPHTNFGRVSAQFIVEWQWRDGGRESRSCGEVHTAIDPARIHNVDRKRRIRVRTGAGTEQKTDAIAAEFKLMARAPRTRMRIQVRGKNARNLLGA